MDGDNKLLYILLVAINITSANYHCTANILNFFKTTTFSSEKENNTARIPLKTDPLVREMFYPKSVIRLSRSPAEDVQEQNGDT